MAGRKKIVFWGIGNTARENIWRIKELSDRFDIVAFTDSTVDDAERDRLWEGYKLISPQAVRCMDVDFLCILSIWEMEIRKKIYDEKLFDLSKILSIHEICMMDIWGKDLDSCYKKQLRTVPSGQIRAAKAWRIYEYMKKRYSYILCDSKYWGIDTDKKRSVGNKKPVWILWLQGFDQAPKIVKVCLCSVKKVLSEDEQLFLLDKDNLFDYIDLPEYIIQKWQEGIIDHTHFSDVIRLRLLNTYGGVWIDATVYFTDSKLPDYIKDSRLFMYSYVLDWRVSRCLGIAANWLIAAEPANKIVVLLEILLNEYWKQENVLLDYNIFHILLALAAECFPDEWGRVEKVLRDPSHLLCGELFHQFDRERFEHIKRMTGVHKLSYKMSFEESEKESFWSHICGME